LRHQDRPKVIVGDAPKVRVQVRVVISAVALRCRTKKFLVSIECTTSWFYVHLPLKHSSVLAALLYWLATNFVSFP
jgi:hypothetical protein